MLARKYHRTFRHAMIFPFIWGALIPLVLLDIFIEIYHRVCFPLYELPLARRGDYIIFDRAKLSYLTATERINCLYCSYANGFLAYAGRIAGDTEHYWCGIQHERRAGRTIPAHHESFTPFGDGDAFERAYPRPGNDDRPPDNFK